MCEININQPSYRVSSAFKKASRKASRSVSVSSLDFCVDPCVSISPSSPADRSAFSPNQKASGIQKNVTGSIRCSEGSISDLPTRGPGLHKRILNLDVFFDFYYVFLTILRCEITKNKFAFGLHRCRSSHSTGRIWPKVDRPHPTFEENPP